jgi:hypothetical protein
MSRLRAPLFILLDECPSFNFTPCRPWRASGVGLAVTLSAAFVIMNKLLMCLC